MPVGVRGWRCGGIQRARCRGELVDELDDERARVRWRREVGFAVVREPGDVEARLVGAPITLRNYFVNSPDSARSSRHDG